MNKYTLTACWGPRLEAPEARARRILGFLEELSTLGDELSAWFLEEQGDVLEPLEPSDPDSTAKALRHQHAHRQEWTHGDRDFSAYLTLVSNGRVRKQRVRVEVRSGITTESYGVKFWNYVLIEFHAPKPSGPLVTVQGVEDVTTLTVKWFSPDWCSVRSGERPELSIEERLSGKPAVGWITYFDTVPAELGGLDTRFHVVRTTGGGAYFWAVSDWYDPKRPSDVALAEQLEVELERLGFLATPVLDDQG